MSAKSISYHLAPTFYDHQHDQITIGVPIKGGHLILTRHMNAPDASIWLNCRATHPLPNSKEVVLPQEHFNRDPKDMLPVAVVDTDGWQQCMVWEDGTGWVKIHNFSIKFNEEINQWQWNRTINQEEPEQ